MSTPRALKPVFGPGYRLFLDQFVTQLTGRRCAPGKLFSSWPSSPICPSCRRNGSFISLKHQFRYSSSSTPPKPPSNDEKDKKDENDFIEPIQFPPGFPPFPPPPPDSSPTPQSSSSDASPSPSSEPDPTPQQQQQQPPQEPPPDTKYENPDLPSAQNSRRSALNRTLSTFMDRAQTTLFAASQRINDLTGYSGIESLKTQISGIESALAEAQIRLHNARGSYKTAVSSRSSTQREVTTLLARQKTWTPNDFERFTSLYRQDYELDAAVASRAAELEEAEREAERLGRELSSGILARYHEEQIWSDKIRRMSTWGTWGLMGVNVLLFFLFQFGAEPWRRQRLVNGFEEKVREALEEERRQREQFEVERKKAVAEEDRARTYISATAAAAAAAEAEAETASRAAQPSAPPVVELPEVTLGGAPTIPWREAFSNLDWWRDTYDELSSDRKVVVRMRDVTLTVLEGVATGATIVTALATIYLRWSR